MTCTPSCETTVPAREEAASISTNPSIPSNKYSHCLNDFWFVESSHPTLRKYLSYSVCNSMAEKYNPHVLHWLNHCSSNNVNPVDPSLADLISYLAMQAQYLPSMSVKLYIRAIRKFFAANLVKSSLFNHPSITTFSQGLDNLPLLSRPHRKLRLTMSKPALVLAGHFIHSQSNWVEEDKVTAWALLLICYFASARVGNILSCTANEASNKTLLWSSVFFLQPWEKITIFLSAPKLSAGKKGHSLYLIKNPEACFVRLLISLGSDHFTRAYALFLASPLVSC